MKLCAAFSILLTGLAFILPAQAQIMDMSHFAYWRIYTGQDGEAKVDRLSWAATPVQDLGSSRDIVHFFVEHASSIAVMSGKPGGHVPMHHAGSERELVLVLRGSLVGLFAARKPQTFYPGDVVLVEHRGKALPVESGPAGYMALDMTLNPEGP